MTVEFVQIEPTTRCNFTCGFCCGRAMTQTDLSLATFEGMLTQFPHVRHLELQGEGEPLMHPQFFDMLALARARGINVSFITNGSLLTADAVARIVDGSVEKLSVSIESADPVTFRAIRGGKLEKVIEGLERLMAARNARHLARPRVGLAVTTLRSTDGAVDGIVALYRRLGLDGGITTQALQRMDAYTATYQPEIAHEFLTENDAALRSLKFRRRMRSIPNRTSSEGFFAKLQADWRPSSRRCPWLDRAMYVNRDGVVTACCMQKDPRDALGKIGDPTEQLVAKRDAMRDELARGTIPAACRGCQLARYATMGKLDRARRAVRVGLRVLAGDA